MSPKKTYWLIFKPRPTDKEWSDSYINQLFKDSPELKEAVGLVQEFSRLMKNRQADKLQNWLIAAQKSQIPELVGFVNGIRQDFKAVEAAFAIEWSNGQTEGQGNRLKFIKRQMYGRANFYLLKARVVHQN
jgi:transposase